MITLKQHEKFGKTLKETETTIHKLMGMLNLKKTSSTKIVNTLSKISSLKSELEAEMYNELKVRDELDVYYGGHPTIKFEERIRK